MRPKTKSVIISILLYILLALMWSGMFICYVIVILLSDVIKYFNNGLLLYVFAGVGLVCLIMPIIFRKKLKPRLPLLLIISSVLSVAINATMFIATVAYLSDFTEEKWDEYPELRYCMTDSLEKKHKIVGKTEEEILELLGKPGNIADYYDYRYEYLWRESMDPYTYDIIFENGVAIRTEIHVH